MDFLTAFVGAFLGALLSLAVSVYVEYQRKPKLFITIEDPPIDLSYQSAPAKNSRFLRVYLGNRPMPPLLKWLSREAALNCSAAVQFHHFSDGAPIFKTPMTARWSSSDEPLSYQIGNDGSVKPMFDIGKYNAGRVQNCFPGSKQLIDIAARFDEDEECYGWSNDNYLPGRGWRNPDWKLGKGRFLVSLSVSSAGEQLIGYFVIENSAGRKDFRLMGAARPEIEKLKAK